MVNVGQSATDRVVRRGSIYWLSESNL